MEGIITWSLFASWFLTNSVYLSMCELSLLINLKEGVDFIYIFYKFFESGVGSRKFPAAWGRQRILWKLESILLVEETHTWQMY